ncbi:hypothetical protein EIK56_18255 [Sphingomonas sp. C8-2]|nr:hypothetical protein EIK56_18255 [Sphingomonas sp. C8-2]
MSALRPHIRAARAYEAACREHGDLLLSGHPRLGTISRNRGVELLYEAEIHARAAEIMEAEEAHSATDWPVQREGC